MLSCYDGTGILLVVRVESLPPTFSFSEPSSLAAVPSSSRAFAETSSGRVAELARRRSAFGAAGFADERERE